MYRFVVLTALAALMAASLSAAETTPKVYAFPSATARATLDDVINGVKTPQQGLAALETLSSSTRLVDATKGDIVWVYAFFRSNGTKAVDVKFKEIPRQLLITRQFRKVLQLASKIAGVAAAQEPIAVSITQYELELPRAELTITGKIVAAGVAAPAPDEDPRWIVVLDFTGGGEDVNAATVSATILTGTREAWAFSADAPISGIADVGVDDKAENIELADTPDAFYVGLNYLPFGDVLKPPSSVGEAFQFKLLLKATRRPSDSFGVGVGLRSGYFSNHARFKKNTLLQIFDTLAPYIAYTRTRDQQEETNAAGETELVRFKRNDVVIGISLDITKALSFVGGGDNDEEK
jgi:hypothetical protein